MTLDQIRSQLIAHVRPYRNKLRRTFHQAQKMPVTRITRIRQQPVFTWIDQQSAGQQQRTGTTRRDQNPPWIDVQAVVRLIKTGNRLAQFRNAARSGVTGLARR
ncbi:hypothetical protein D3C81_1466700 [compost metagenome]